MKILYIIESLTSGGKERRLMSLIQKMLEKDEVKIEIIILSKDIHYRDIFNWNLKIHFFKRNILKDKMILLKFNSVLKSFQPDVVHCWDNIAAFHFAPICNFKRIPFLNSMISTAPPKLSRFSKRFFFNVISYPFSDVILSNSKAGLYSFRVPKNKGKCIHNGFDLERTRIKTSENSIREKFGIKTKNIVGMTGAFHDRKDYNTFIKAANLVLKSKEDVTFVAIGDGPNLNKIKNSIEKDSLPSFKFVGKQDDIESIVNTFTIGVLATFTEGISNAIMEYMSFEKPVIATSGGGTNELVIDNESGFLVEPKNINQLADKIIFLLENPKVADQMGSRGRLRIENHFSIDKMIERFYCLYKDFDKSFNK